MFYLLVFISALLATALLTVAVRRVAFSLKVVDEPDPAPGAGRKIHSRTTPLLGGLAIFLGYFSLLFFFSDRFLAGNLDWSHLIGFGCGGLILMIGGFLDDRYDLRPRWQILFPLAAIATIISGGVEIVRLTSPFGGTIDLQPFVIISPILIAIWLLGMMYTTKLLDGVDGLVSGISLIGGFIIFLFTLTTRYYQPDIALAALLLAGAAAGFLIFNWHPAKIFLGEGGSLLLGYILGVLAIISGSKIAVALLIMGIPILDVAWTIIRRLREGKNPLRFADQRHLHHRLLSLGLSQPQTVGIFFLFSFIFGLSGLFLQSRGKLWALLILLGLMSIIVIALRRLDQRRHRLGIWLLAAASAVLLFAPAVLAAETGSAAILDSDGDGYSDELEIAVGYSPFNPGPVKSDKSDMDRDGLSDYWELKFKTDPFLADSDGDGLNDFKEIDQARNPLASSTKKLPQAVTINLKEQTMTYLVSGQPWKTWPISSGKPGMPTPKGEFKVVNKSPKAWSKAYGLWMPYWLGLGGNGLRNGSIGIHELPVWPGGYREGEDHLGKAVSHGCIRLGVGPAKYLYERLDTGTSVIIR